VNQVKEVISVQSSLQVEIRCVTAIQLCRVLLTDMVCHLMSTR
jgi:hypothetical protein